jgi:hypothetical protein
MAVCTIIGTLIQVDGSTPAAGVSLVVKRVLKDGVLISTGNQSVLSDEDGLVSFTLPRDSVAYLSGPVEGFNVADGVAIAIPDAATANLEDLAPSVSVTVSGVTYGQLATLQTAFDALVAGAPGALDTLNELAAALNDDANLAATLTLSITNEATARASADTTLQTNITNEATARASGDAAALASANGYTDAELATLDLSPYQTRAEKNQADGYAGLDGSGLIPDNRIPASIARDSEVTSAIELVQDAIAAIPASSLSYLVYTALLNQTGTDAPVATVLENTLGGTPVWSRSMQGVYVLTLAGAFTVGKTAVFVTPTRAGATTAAHIIEAMSNVSADSLTIVTSRQDGTNGTSGELDSLLTNVSIKIEVYS